MKLFIHNLSRRPFRAGLTVMLAALALVGAITVWAQAIVPTLNIAPSGTNGAGEPTYEVNWSALSGAAYSLQGSDALGVSNNWQTVSNLSAPTNILMFVPLAATVANTNGSSAKFYRVTAVEASVSSVSPSVVTNGGQQITLTGQFLNTNLVVTIDGVPVTAVWINANTLLVTVPALVNGLHDIQVLDGANALVSLPQSLTVASTNLTDLLPPEMPVGAPIAGERSTFILTSGNANGEVRATFTDLDIASVGPDFALARTYRSKTGPTTPVGYGWDFSYNIFAVQNTNGIVLNDGNGRADFLPRQADGTFYTAGMFRQGATNPATQVFTLTFADKGKWIFNAFDGSPKAGKISSSVDRNSNTLAFAYNSTGQLTNVTDALGRPVTFAYNGSGLLTSVQDFVGRTVTYTYDANTNLLTVTTPAVTGTPNGNNFPSGKTTTYTYSSGFGDQRLNHNLLTITDPAGQTVLTWTYQTNLNPSSIDYDRVASVAEGPTTPEVFSYVAQTPAPANNYATTKTIENSPVGNVTECTYDSLNRLVKQRDYTGRATPGVVVTDSLNRPTGQLRAGDPTYFETTITRNAASLPLTVTHPRGGTVSYTYDSANASPRERGNLLQTVETPAPGFPADQSQRTNQWTYQPGFGRPEGGSAIAPASRTDALGRVTTGTYDAKGNCLSVQPPGISTGHNFEYNAAGQTIAHISPADGNSYRRRDTLGYFATGPQKGYPQSAVADANGLALTTTYACDAVGNVTNVVDPRGNDSRFVYNQLDQVVRVQSPPGPGGTRSQTDIFYVRGISPIRLNNVVCTGVGDRVGHVNTIRFDENGNPLGTLSTAFGRDAIGRLTSVTNATGGVTTYDYNAAGQLVLARSPQAVNGQQPAAVAARSYDERGRVFQQTAAPGSADQSTTQYDYDSDGNLSRVSAGLEATPRVTTIEHDGFFRYYPSTASAGNLAVIDIGDDGRIKHNGTGGGSKDPLSGAMASKDYIGDNDWYGPPLSEQHGGTGSSTYEEISDKLELGELSYMDVVSNLQWSGEDLRIRHNGPPLSVEHGGAGGSRSGSAFSNLGIGVLAAFNTLNDLNWDISGQLGFRGQPLSFAPGRKSSALSRPRTVTDPLGNVTTFHYDASGACVSARVDGETNDVPGSAGNTALAQTDFTYDALGRAIGDTAWNFHAWTTGFFRHENSGVRRADNGQVLAVTNTLGHVTTRTYDTAGRPASVTDAKNNVYACFRDQAGNVSSVTGTCVSDLGNPALVLTTTYGYDKLNRRTNATDNAGNSASYAYDSRGNLVKHVDARGVLSRYEYDGLNRLTRSSRDADGDNVTLGVNDLVTLQAYDDNSRLLASTDANDHTTSYAYDALNRRIAVTSADGTVSSTAYDVHGNVTSDTDANGTTVVYAYDSLNRLTGKTITPGGGVASSTTAEEYQYDGLARLVRAVNNGSTNAFTYDSLGRPLTETQNGLTTTSAYDAAGNRQTVAYPGGRTLGYTYDAANLCRSLELLSTTDGDTLGVLNTNFFIGGQSEGFSRRNGTYTLLSYLNRAPFANFPAITLGSMHDDIQVTDMMRGSVVARIQNLNTNGAVISDVSLSYDAALNRTGRVEIATGMATNSRVYAFDAANRLINTVVRTNGVIARTTVYTLDKMGNRLNVSGDNHPGAYTLDATTPEPADAQENQYTTTPVGAFTYDKNGNRTVETVGGSPVRTFAYDYASRMVAVSALAGGGIVNITITNGGFESNSVSPGAFVNLLPTGWSLYDPATIINQANNTNVVGVIQANPGTQFYPGGVPQGNNAGRVYLAGPQLGVPAGLQQTLTATLQASTSYTLTVRVGNTASGFSLPGSTGGAGAFYNLTNFPGYRIELVAGTTVVASDNNSLGGTIAEGQFVLATVNLTTTMSPAQLGQPLTIRLINLKTPGTTQAPRIEVDFDDVQLTATTAPALQPLAVYAYDALGRRTQKILNPTTTPVVTGFVYDGGGVIEERDGAGAVMASAALPVGASKPVAILTKETSIGSGVWRNVASTTDYTASTRVSSVSFLRRAGINYWPHADDEGSTVALTLDNGTVPERYQYADFGEPAFFNGSGASIGGSAVGNPVLYDGMRLDAETGFYIHKDQDSYLEKNTDGLICGYMDHFLISPNSNPPRYFDPRTGSTGSSDAHVLSCHTGVKATGHSSTEIRRNSR